eukprot:403370091
MRTTGDRAGVFNVDGNLKYNNWYIILIRAKSDSSSFQLRDLTFTLVNQDTTSQFFPYGKTSLSFDSIVVGIDKDRKNAGFIGNIRNIKLFSGSLTDAISQKIQYSYIIPRRDQKMQILLDDIDNLRNEGDRANFEIIRNNGVISNEVDFLGSFDCYDPPTSGFTQILKFNKSMSLPQQTFSTSQISNSNFNTSLQMWVKRDGSVKFNTLTDQTEVLFNHVGVTKASFTLTDNNNMRLEGRESNKYGVMKFPHNRWVFIQIVSTNSLLQATLFDDQNSQEGTITVTYSSSQTAISRQVTIGQYFNGLIMGVKFYKTQLPPQTGPHTFSYSIEKDSNALLYFWFTQGGQNQDFVFQNIVQNDIGRTIVASGTKELTNDYVIIGTNTYAPGSLTGTTNFDGYTCKDNREKAFMVSDTSYLSTTFTLNNTLSQFTVEFWVRLTATLTGGAFFLTMQDTSRNQQLYLTIQQESNQLKCYPFYQQNSSMKLDYLDYQNSLQDWIHITCSLDSTRNVIEGQIYYKTLDYVYYTDITNITTRSLPQQGYKLFININPETLRNGVSKSYYSEIRFWDYTRNQNQIRLQRFMRLNITLERANLYSYMKLGYAQYGGQLLELDYADANLNQKVTFKSVTWQQNTDLLICPEGYFKSTKETTCYRQALQTLYIAIYKTQNSRYVITPRFSAFRNFYSRDNSNLLFDHNWEIQSTDTQNQTNTRLFPTYFNPQATSQDLNFDFDQVTDRPGRYDFSLKMTDKNNWQNQMKANVRLSAKRCANIFDSSTKLSFIQIDLKSTKTVENAVFTYDFSECFDYVFDASSLTFSLDIPGVAMSSSDHNAQARTVTIRTTTQSDIPSNDYFYLRIKGVWRNPNNRNDILEYHLIYACRYVAKLVISLKTNYDIATIGDTVQIDFDAKLSNLNKAVVDRKYTLTWICPSQIEEICRTNPVGQPLKLNYDQVIKAGIALWRPTVITLVGNTNFIQGDGTRQTQESIQVTWINLKPEGELIQLSKNLVQSSIIAYEFVVTQMTEDQLDLKWSMSPSINNDCLFNSFDRKQYVFKGSCLSVNTNYQLKVNLYYKNQTQLLNTRTTVFKLQNPPSGGSLSCNPTSGNGFVTPTTCVASGWTVAQQPSKYQFYVLDTDGKLVAMTPISIFNSATFTPPPSTRIYVRVFDASDQFTQSSISATFSRQTYSNSTLSRLTQTLQKINPSTLNTNFIQELQWTASYINSYQQQIPVDLAISSIRQITQGILQQSQQINQFNSTEQKAYFIQGLVQIFSQISNYQWAVDISSFNQIQQIILSTMSQSSIYKQFVGDQDFLKIFFQIQANIIDTLDTHQQQSRLSDLSKSSQKECNNITAQLRQIVTNQEQLISANLFEGQSFVIKNEIFNISIQKYSRLANILYDQSFTDNQYIQYSFPLSTGLEPTDRQSLTVINFEKSPFVGSFFNNQSAISKGSIYFSYRDQNGKYLSGDSVIGSIQMAYRYQFSKVLDILNQTTCGYIKAEETQWENSSCSTTFDVSNNYIYCSCRHMSYYAIIDDYLRREAFPIDNIDFKNWLSLIPFGYMLIIFIFGMIYTNSKDNQDFRTLNNQDNTLGLELLEGNSVTIKTLLFRRKVFFTGFGDKFNFNTLLRIMIIKLHPLSQLKYNFDPEMPRFYKFLYLYTRAMILLAISFFFISEYKDIDDVRDELDNDLIISLVKIFVILGGGSFLFSPFPSFILSCCRSRYYLIRQKGGISFMQDDEKLQANNGQSQGPTEQKTNPIPVVHDKSNPQDKQPTYEVERFTNVKIDPNLPLKLLFLLDRASTDKIIREYPTNMNYSSGNSQSLAQKLYELDIDINPQQVNVTDPPVYFHEQNHTDNIMSDDTNRRLHENQTPKKMKSIDQNDIQESQHNPINNMQYLQINQLNINPVYDSKDQLSSISAARGSGSHKPSSNNLEGGLFNSRPISASEIDYDLREEEEFKNSNNRGLPTTPHLGNGIQKINIQQAILVSDQHVEQMQAKNLTTHNEQENFDDDFSRSSPITARSRIDYFNATTKKLNFNQNRYTENEHQNFGDSQQIGKSNTDLNMDSFLGSLESQLDADEKKELIEQSRYCGRMFGNIIAMIINLGILVAVFYFYITEEYYMEDNNWIWVVVFFASQFLGFILIDFLVLIFMALCVAKCCKKKKSCLARWMKESLYIYEDYKYVCQFVETKIE